MVSIVFSFSIILLANTPCAGLQPFTVADEIGLALFESLDLRNVLQFSPDENYFAVYTERGRLDLNRVEDSMRFYRSQDVKNFLEHSDGSQLPSPVWVTFSTDKTGGS